MAIVEKCGPYYNKISVLIKRKFGGAQVTQSVKCPTFDFGSDWVLISQFLSWSIASGSALTVWSLLGILFLSLSLCPSPTLSLSLSVSLSPSLS